MDSIDSLSPSSLPPELGSLDMRWDDDPRSVGTIDLLSSQELDLDGDAGERTTAVPDIPIAQLVQKTMAEADAREQNHSESQDFELDTAPDYWRAATTSNSAGGPPPITQPAPSREIPNLERAQTPSVQYGNARPQAQLWPEPPGASAADLAREQHGNRNQPPRSNLPPFSRSAGALRPSSSRPPAALESRFSAPPTVRGSDHDGLRHQMKDRYATGDFSGALQLAETLLESDSGDLDAQRFATSCRDVLTQMLTSRVGSFDQVVEVVLTPEELRWLTLDHRAGFFLSLVDGILTIEELLDISGMARLESLRILSTLIDQKVLRLAPR